jgi:hypothetical protein
VQDVDNRIAEISAALVRRSPQQPGSAAPVGVGASPDPNGATAADIAAAERDVGKLQDELSSLELQRDALTIKCAGLEQDLQQRKADAKRAQEDFDRLQGIELKIAEAAPASFEPPGSTPSGLLFSLALGCLLGFVVFLRAAPVIRRLSSRSQIESILALPVIGLLPGTDDSPEPYAPLELPVVVRRVRLAAEGALVLFLLATTVGLAMLDGYQSRLTAEPLSAVADSFHILARHFFS